MQAQIDRLAARMERGIEELKEMLQGFDNRVRSVEHREAACQPVVQARLDAAWRKIDENSTQIDLLNKTIQELRLTITELKRTQSLLSWLGGIVGSAVVIWVVSQVLAVIR